MNIRRHFLKVLVAAIVVTCAAILLGRVIQRSDAARVDNALRPDAAERRAAYLRVTSTDAQSARRTAIVPESDFVVHVSDDGMEGSTGPTPLEFADSTIAVRIINECGTGVQGAIVRLNSTMPEGSNIKAQLYADNLGIVNIPPEWRSSGEVEVSAFRLRTITSSVGELRSTHELRLSPIYSISGRAVDEAGAPVHNAQVYLVPSQIASDPKGAKLRKWTGSPLARSHEDGTFVVGYHEAVHGDLVVRKVGTGASRKAVSILQNAELMPDVGTLILAGDGTIDVHVVSQTGQPLQGVHLCFLHEIVEQHREGSMQREAIHVTRYEDGRGVAAFLGDTDKAGRLVMGGLRPGLYRIARHDSTGWIEFPGFFSCDRHTLVVSPP